MEKLKVIVFLLFLSSLNFLSLTANAQNSTALIGIWKRIPADGKWVMYHYQKNGHLLRNTDADKHWLPLGQYVVVKETIYFKKNPDHYTPVHFIIKEASCHGHQGKTLFLYDKQSGKAYGCYFNLDGQH